MDAEDGMRARTVRIHVAYTYLTDSVSLKTNLLSDGVFLFKEILPPDKSTLSLF